MALIIFSRHKNPSFCINNSLDFYVLREKKVTNVFTSRDIKVYFMRFLRMLFQERWAGHRWG